MQSYQEEFEDGVVVFAGGCHQNTLIQNWLDSKKLK